MLHLLFLIAGLGLTLMAANWLVDGSASIAKRLNVSDMVIGLTIVALGTSTPELAINIFSAIEGSTALAIGNVLGSNIANILLILGVASLVGPLVVSQNTIWKDIPFSFMGVLVLGFMANDMWSGVGDETNFISRTDGLILLCFLVIFIVYTFEMARSYPQETEEVAVMSVGKSILLTLVGIVGLFIGGKLLVDGAIGLAEMAGISERVIGLTVVAIGTSLPELAAAVVAAKKGKTDLAIGNVMGSNILNIFLILGVTATIHPMPFEAAANLDLSLVMLASLLLFGAIFMYNPRRIGKRAGVIFVALYIIYLVVLVVMK
ncbi:MAG TPA: calcium/sodium antiporter [Bacteroidetes bacterium]|nr:calcium/sodium antiporter [Bacteroidota bacterium]